MITRVEINGFKSLDQFELDLYPGLNILIGPNGGGKTNIILFFEFLSSIIKGDLSEAITKIGGAGSTFRRSGDDLQPEISATIYGSCNTGKKFFIYKYCFVICLSPQLDDIYFKTQSIHFKYTSAFIEPTKIKSESSDWDFSFAIEWTEKLKSSMKLVYKDKFPFDIPGYERNKSNENDYKKWVRRFISPHDTIMFIMRFTDHFSPVIEDLLGGEIFNIIPSSVKMPENISKPPGIEKDGKGLATTLFAIKSKKSLIRRYPFRYMYNRFRPPPSVNIEDLLNYIRLANDSIIDIDVSNDQFDNQLKVTIGLKNDEYAARLPLGMMSDGTIKWITLISALMTSYSICSIEEPENYLHPYMQSQILNIMRNIMLKREGYFFCIMTTHSETILNSSNPDEIIIVSLKNGRTKACRCNRADDIKDEIKKTGFGLAYYYLAGALSND